MSSDYKPGSSPPYVVPDSPNYDPNAPSLSPPYQLVDKSDVGSQPVNVNIYMPGAEDNKSAEKTTTEKTTTEETAADDLQNTIRSAKEEIVVDTELAEKDSLLFSPGDSETNNSEEDKPESSGGDKKKVTIMTP